MWGVDLVVGGVGWELPGSSPAAPQRSGRSLRKAGVPHVVCWRWEVEDQAALEFANVFYKALLQYKPASHAGAAAAPWDAGEYRRAFEQGRMAVQHWEESSAQQRSVRAKTGIRIETDVWCNRVMLMSVQRDPDGECAREREREQESASARRSCSSTGVTCTRRARVLRRRLSCNGTSARECERQHSRSTPPRPQAATHVLTHHVQQRQAERGSERGQKKGGRGREGT